MIPEVLRVRLSFWDVWTRWKAKAFHSLKNRGVAGTIRITASAAKGVFARRWMLFCLSNPWYRYLDERFDQRFAVDTAGLLELPELQSDPRFQHSRRYEPSPQPIFIQMLRQLDVDYSKFVFIDFGCGKGKALLLASDLPFQRIIGVELSSQLIHVAEKNLSIYPGGARKPDLFHLACTDASDYRIPPEPAVFYFYYPFQAEVMRKILENIGRSLATAPREIYVLYLNPVHRDLLDESGFLTPVKQTYLYSIHKASGV
jgi:SAM-dependent methyltransferase